MSDNIIPFVMPHQTERASDKMGEALFIGWSHAPGVAMTACGYDCLRLSDVVQDHGLYWHKGVVSYLGLLTGEVLGTVTLPFIGVLALVIPKDKENVEPVHYRRRKRNRSVARELGIHR